MPDGDDKKANALAAYDAEIAALEAARDKLDEAITVKDMNNEDSGAEQAEKAKIDRQIAELENERAEYETAATVVSAPTPGEIDAVNARIQDIRNVAVEDALVSAGMGVISEVLSAARNLTNKNQKA